GVAGGILEAANGDDIARGLVQADGGTHQEGLGRRTGRLDIQLNEVRDVLPGGGVDEHRRAIGVQRPRNAGDQRGRRRRQVYSLWKQSYDDRPWAEAVEGVPLGRIDVTSGEVRRHGIGRVIQAPPGGRRRVGFEEYGR